MTGSITTWLRASLVAQAVVTGGLAAGPLAPDRWLPFVVGVAAGALLLAWFIGTGTRSAWTMTLGFEALALVVGGTGAAAGHWVPGTVFALVAAVLLLRPQGRSAFPKTPQVTAAPVRLTPPSVITAAPPTIPPPPASPPPGVAVAPGRPTSLPPVLPPLPLPPAPVPASPLLRPVATILPGR